MAIPIPLLLGMRSCSTSGLRAASLPLLLLLLSLLGSVGFTRLELLPGLFCELADELLSPN
jgi:hypothetical protein